MTARAKSTIARAARRTLHAARKQAAQHRVFLACWHGRVDELQCTPERFHELRRDVLLLNREQTARVLRVGRSTVANWESARNPVPFTAFLALLLIAESERYRLAPDEQWRDWEFIQWLPHGQKNPVTFFVNGKTGSCHTAEDMEALAVHWSKLRVAALDSENCALRDKVLALTQENQEIRTLFRNSGVTAEMHGMKDRLGELLGRINTARLLDFTKAAA